MSPVQTRDRILDAAQSLIARVGSNGMSYKHLSDAVGIRKASVHHHFPTKTDLLVGLVERYGGEVAGRLDTLLGAELSGREKLDRYLRHGLELLNRGDCEGACPVGMLVAEIQTLDERLKTLLLTFYKKQIGGLHEILRQGLQDGSLRFRGSIEDLAPVVFSLLQGSLLVTRGGGSVGLFERTVEQFMALVSAG